MSDHQPTIINGIGIPIDFAQAPILVIAQDVDTLKAYLGSGADYSLASMCSTTVGPMVEISLPSMAGALAARRFAEKLGTRQIGKEITKEEEAEAKAAGLVVVFGYSDDGTEFRGAIRDEAGTGDILFNAKGTFIDSDRLEELEGLVADGLIEGVAKFATITSTFGQTGHTYKTTIPHAVFRIEEDGEQFSEGLVFHIDDI